MNDDDLKKKLSILKSAPVPKGYWENYWPRLQAKLVSESRRIGVSASDHEDVTPTPPHAETPIRWMFPAFALAFPVLFGVFYLGQRHAEEEILRIPHVRLVSDQDDERAKRVFQEMLQLFPNRVNWITYVNGKVDFSISSVAYKEAEPLIPYVVTIPRPKGGFEARVLLRPGQEAAVQAPWMEKTTVELKWRLDAVGQAIHMNCRLAGANVNAGVEGDARLKPNQGSVFGALRWRSELLQVQITRLEESSKPAPAKTEKEEPKADPVRI